MSELTVAAGLARGLVELAVSKGASHAELVGRSGICAEELQDVDRRIPFEKYVALMRAGKALANDPALALHHGETNDMSQISVVGLIAYACETFRRACRFDVLRQSVNVRPHGIVGSEGNAVAVTAFSVAVARFPTKRLAVVRREASSVKMCHRALMVARLDHQ